MKTVGKRVRKTTARIIGIIIFVFLGLVIFSGVSEVLRGKTGGHADMIHSFYDLDKNSLDVLVLGSSHGFCSFQPNLLWDEYGVASFVMCSQRQTVAQSYYLLQEALKYQKPKVVILEGYYFFFSGKHTGDAALRWGHDGTRFSKLKCEMIEDFLEEMSWKEKLSYYIPFIKYHSRWSGLVDADFNKSDTWTKGAVFSKSVQQVIDPVLPNIEGGIPKVFLDYFGRIEDICEENDIKLLVYVAPYTYLNEEEKNKNDFNRKYSTYIALEPYMMVEGVPYLFYQKNGEIDIDYSKDFQDYSHMNIYGALKITENLGAYLHENYDLLDHRGEEAYQSWEEDCKKFRKKVKKLNLSK